MKTEQARASIGKLVMSHDPGSKMITSVSKAHGPYRLLRITKGGRAILEGIHERSIKPALLDLVEGQP